MRVRETGSLSIVICVDDGDFAGIHDDHVHDVEDDDDDYEYSHKSGRARLTRST